MEFSHVSLFLLAFVPLIFSPGPANLACVALGGARGVVATLPFLCGVELASILWAFLVLWGAQSFFATFPWLLPVIQLIGYVYLIYLGVGLYFSSFDSSMLKKEDSGKGFIDGLTLQILNPKNLTLMLMAYSFFGESNELGAASVYLTLTLYVLSHLSWTVFGGVIEHFVQEKQSKGIKNKVLALSLILTSIYLLTKEFLF